MSRIALVVVAVAALAACQKGSDEKGGAKTGPMSEQWKQDKASKLGGVGKPLAKGAATELRVAPKGKHATYLIDAEKPRIDGIPPQMRVGALWAVALDGGEPRRLGSGVTNVPGGWLFSADGRWVLVLEGYNPASASGNLVAVDLADPKSEPKTLGQSVTYMLASPDSSTVMFVSGGVLKAGPLPNGPFRDVAGEVSTADFTPDSKQILFRRRLTAAGGLFLTPVTVAAKDAGPLKLGDYVGDYSMSPDGKHIVFAQRSEVQPTFKDLFVASAPAYKSKRIAESTQSFAFSPDGKYLAWTDGFRSDNELGDLFVGDTDGTKGRKVGDKVGPFSFAPDSAAIAYLEYYDYNAKAGPESHGGAGVLGRTDLPDGKPKRIGNRVPNYAWGADSTYVAFLSRFFKPIYSVDLMLYAKGWDSAARVKVGSFGYSFGGRNDRLFYRSNCIRGGRACDLYEIDPSKVPPPPPAADAGTATEKAAPLPEKKIIEGLYTFTPSKDGSRLLITYPRWETKNFDVAVMNIATKERKTLDSQILLPPAFAAEDGSRVAYIINDGERSGVYVATEVP